MLIIFVFGVLILVIALLFAMFSSFIPFMENFGDAIEYNTAYYGALSAVERGSLALRYRGPGFDGESGWLFSGNSINTGNIADSFFSGFYSYGGGNTDMYRNVRSKTTTIPFVNEGNVETIFINPLNLDSITSSNFNKIDYNLMERIPLGVDDVSSNDYYSGINNSFIIPGDDFELFGVFRLNPYLYQTFGGEFQDPSLCLDDSGFCNCDARNLCNLPIISWNVKGEYDGTRFTLLPRESVSFASYQDSIVTDSDSLLRKKHINDAHHLFVLGENINPVNPSVETLGLNILSEKERAMREDSISTYQDLLSNTKTTNSTLNLSLVNFLISNMGGVYPFLEYQFTSNTPISDRFFRLDGHGKVGAYDVLIRVYKPTLEHSSVGDFTVIF